MPRIIRLLGTRSIRVIISCLVISLALMTGGRALAFGGGTRQNAPPVETQRSGLRTVADS